MKSRLLFISSRPLFPIVGGDRIRTVQQLEYLSERYDVDILYITHDNNNEIPAEYKHIIGKIYRFKISKFKCVLQTCRFLFNKLPLQVNYYLNNEVDKFIGKIIFQYKYVFCNNIRTAEYVRHKTGLIKYLDFVDAISMNYDKARRKAKGLKKFIYELDYRRCKSYEQECLNNFDACAVISDIDNRYITAAENQIYTVGNMVKIPETESIALHDENNKIIFVGKMSYEPNIVAVSYFSHKIFPALKEFFPDVQFIIVGADPDDRVKNLTSIAGVKVLGFVESVSQYYQNSTIVVAPMLTGAGIQNKIIQAMSYGCCVATSPIGAEGLTINNNEIAIYSEEEAWVHGLKKLILDMSLRKEMGLKAREYVKANLSKEVIGMQFWNFIDSANNNLVVV